MNNSIRRGAVRQFGRVDIEVAIALAFVLGVANVSRATTFTETVALTGDAAPGGPVGALFLEFGVSLINDNGSVAFLAAREAGVGGVTTEDALGIWKRTANGLTPLTVGDPPAPGIPGAVFDSLISVPQFSNTDALFEEFRLKVGVGGVTETNDTGAWLFSTGGDQLIYREGSSLPGLPAEAELFFAFPRMNAGGKVAVLARFRNGIGGITANNDRGLWIKSGASFNLVARAGDAASGAPAGAILSGFNLSSFSDNGVVVSLGTLLEGTGGVTSENSQAIFTNRTGAFALDYREGGVTSSAEVFDRFQSATTSNQGRIAIDAHLKRGLGGVGVFDDRGIWVEAEAGLREVIRTDDPMPGVAGRKFRSFSNLVLNDADHVAFAASSGSSVGFDSIFSEGIDGELKLVARAFNAAPGTQDGVLFDFDHIDFVGIPKLMMNDAGQVAFIAGLTGTGINAGNDFGLWAQDPQGMLKLIAREGDSIEVSPGDSRVVQKLNFGGMNEVGHIAFDSIFTDGTSGVFISTRVAVALPGDFDLDRDVDGADFLMWQRGESPRGAGALDLADWRANFGAHFPASASSTTVPEPSTATLLIIMAVGSRWRRQRAAPRVSTTR